MDIDYCHVYHNMLDVGVSPSSLGNLVGTGSYTLVLQPFYWLKKSSIGNPVFIITEEKEKFNFLENLYKNSSAKVERLNKEDFTDEYQEIFSLLEQNGFDIFYSTKMEKVEYLNLKLWDAFSESSGFGTTSYTSKSLPVDYLVEEFESNYLYFTQQDIIEEKAKTVFNAVKKALSAVKESEDSEFMIDIHEQQFVSYEGEIFCIDPVLYNYVEYLRP